MDKILEVLHKKKAAGRRENDQGYPCLTWWPRKTTLCEDDIRLRPTGGSGAGEVWLENTSGRENRMGSEAWRV